MLTVDIQQARWIASIRLTHSTWCECGDFKEHLRRWLTTGTGITGAAAEERGAGDGTTGGEETTDAGEDAEG
ncbi:ORF2 [Torque teno equus virus 2]|uniref:ORF2 n=1 Tax=Torque teno equus virus 2 TaxID=2834153 RepID=A0AAE7RB20_9VIRU|nr:ORF2 [Torque teno equus virus 2]QUW04986.1 ORF2 [Torque teno equus virus 2]